MLIRVCLAKSFIDLTIPRLRLEEKMTLCDISLEGKMNDILPVIGHGAPWRKSCYNGQTLEVTMTENSDVPRVVYRNLLADEERVLKGFEQEVLSVLLKNQMTFRPLWTSRMDPPDRLVRLYVLDPQHSRVLLELPSSHLALLSPKEVRARLEEQLRQPSDS